MNTFMKTPYQKTCLIALLSLTDFLFSIKQYIILHLNFFHHAFYQEFLRAAVDSKVFMLGEFWSTTIILDIVEYIFRASVFDVHQSRCFITYKTVMYSSTISLTPADQTAYIQNHPAYYYQYPRTGCCLPQVTYWHHC